MPPPPPPMPTQSVVLLRSNILGVNHIIYYSKIVHSAIRLSIGGWKPLFRVTILQPVRVGWSVCAHLVTSLCSLQQKSSSSSSIDISSSSYINNHGQGSINPCHRFHLSTHARLSLQRYCQNIGHPPSLFRHTRLPIIPTCQKQCPH